MKLDLPKDTISRSHFVKALEIANIILNAGYETFIVGGAVRDALLGIPAPDIDICTACPSNELEKIIPDAKPWGLGKYSVFRLPFKRGHFEIARFREETSCDGRHCEVRFADSFTNDVVRRDFTINALAVHPTSLEIVDLVGGIADLSAKTVRAVGDPLKRYQEDKLRVLRAVRFAVKLDFKIHAEDETAIKKLADCVGTLSTERIREELEGILRCPRPGEGFNLLVRLGIWRGIFNEETPFECSNITQRIALLNRAASVKIPLVGIWALLLAPIDLKDKDFCVLYKRKLEVLRHHKKERERISSILDGLHDALNFNTLNTEELISLADSSELPIVLKLAGLVESDGRFETGIMRIFPNLGSHRFLTGDALREALQEIPIENVHEILVKLRFAELKGEVRSLESAKHFITSMNL